MEQWDLKIEFLVEMPQFVPVVTKWLFDEWGGDLPGTDLSFWRAGVESRLRRKKIPLTLVAVDHEKAIGTSSIYIDDMDGYGGYSPWLAAVFVSKDHRNRGVGSALVRRTMDIAGKLGISMLYLFTPDRMSFYRRLGWDFLERTVYRRKEVTIMSIALPAE